MMRHINLRMVLPFKRRSADTPREAAGAEVRKGGPHRESAGP